MRKGRCQISLVIVLGVAMSLFLSGCATIKSDWQKALQINTTEAYKEFLDQHPQSEFTSETEARIRQNEDKEWNEAAKVDNLGGYIKFFCLYSHTKYLKELREKVREFLGQIAYQAVNKDLNMIKTIRKDEHIFSLSSSTPESRKENETALLLTATTAKGAGGCWIYKYFGQEYNQATFNILGREHQFTFFADPSDPFDLNIDSSDNKDLRLIYLSGTGVMLWRIDEKIERVFTFNIIIKEINKDKGEISMISENR